MNIVSISKVVPFEGIPHAGGEYYLQHIRVLSKNHSVTVVAPYEERNLEAVKHLDLDSVHTRLTGKLFWTFKLGRCFRRVINARRRINPLYPSAELAGALASKGVRELLRRADAIEIQWNENVGIIPWIRRINKHASITVVSHDILCQKYERQIDLSCSFPHSFISRLRVKLVKHYESTYLAAADRVVVFSDKDRFLLESIAGLLDITVVHPPLADAIHKGPQLETINTEPRTVLFTGAFTRPENHAGALWLVREVWPQVLKNYSGAQLVLAGSGPNDELIGVTQTEPSVSLTGYVANLDDVYKRADCFVAPLFQGAGVKFKVITALSWGIPTVATSTAVEGIGNRELYIQVTEDPVIFAHAILQVLRVPHEAQRIASASRDWCHATYGRAQFEASLCQLYGPSHLASREPIARSRHGL